MSLPRPGTSRTSTEPSFLPPEGGGSRPAVRAALGALTASGCQRVSRRPGPVAGQGWESPCVCQPVHTQHLPLFNVVGVMTACEYLDLHLDSGSSWFHLACLPLCSFSNLISSESMSSWANGCVPKADRHRSEPTNALNWSLEESRPARQGSVAPMDPKCLPKPRGSDANELTFPR